MGKPFQTPTLGFIGVRGGLAHAQFRAVCRLLVDRDGPGALTGVEVARRGNDGWGDADFDRIIRWMCPVPRVVIHEVVKPGEPTPAGTEGPTHPSALERNRAVIDHSDVLLACPPVAVEEARSRTWVSIRYAKKVGKLVVLVYPDGTVEAGGREYFLVVDRHAAKPVSVFVGRDPRTDGYDGLLASPVLLETLPLGNRAGTNGPASARPILGRSARGPLRYREFPSEKEMTWAGFVPVGNYRVCDAWDDYHFPWVSPPAEDVADVDTGGEPGATDPIRRAPAGIPPEIADVFAGREPSEAES